MKIFILADNEQRKEILSISPGENASITFDLTMPEDGDLKNYNLFFVLSDYKEINPEKFEGKPVFINEVIETLAELNFPGNFYRINGWPGFLESPPGKWFHISRRKMRLFSVHSTGKLFL